MIRISKPYELQAQLYPARVAIQNERGAETTARPFAIHEYRVFKNGIVIKHVKLWRTNGTAA